VAFFHYSSTLNNNNGHGSSGYRVDRFMNEKPGGGFENINNGRYANVRGGEI